MINEIPDNYTNPQIQPGDALMIIVSARTPELAEPFNLASGMMARSADATSPFAYLVSSEGTIEMPMIGTVDIGGLNRQEVTELLQNRISVYLENPIVNVRIINFRFTVLGEVNQPGTAETSNEKITIMEAIAQSGDMTLFALRDSVLIIRTENNIRTSAFVNFQDANLINSPYYYLRQNDMIYVLPARQKNWDMNFRPISTVLGIVGGALGLFFAIFRR
ncbi:MAG: polysaccharide biosynthesis/export family protein [Weeksellaceae bacterium]|nr:polysaccharide biosynthesis/export family protein [Weeksellaceae bacterium]